MVESVYIRGKFATKEENIKQVVNSQLGQIDTKIRELGTRIDDHGGQRIRNVGRPLDASDASTKSYTDELNNENIALFANHFVESVVNGEDGQPMIDPIRKRLTDIALPIEQSDAVNKEFVDGVRREVEAVSEAVEAVEKNKTNMGGQVVTNVGHPTENNHAATKDYVDDELLLFNGFSGIPGRLRQIKNIDEPTENTDVATKFYVDQIREEMNETKTIWRAKK